MGLHRSPDLSVPVEGLHRGAELGVAGVLVLAPGTCHPGILTTAEGRTLHPLRYSPSVERVRPDWRRQRTETRLPLRRPHPAPGPAILSVVASRAGADRVGEEHAANDPGIIAPKGDLIVGRDEVCANNVSVSRVSHSRTRAERLRWAVPHSAVLEGK